MYLNRITISFPYKIVYFNDRIKEFNQAASYVENLLFDLLPKKTNLGGYGFLNINLTTNEYLISENKFRTGGQIVTSDINDTLFTLKDFLKKDNEEKFEFLLDIFEKTIKIANKTLLIDYSDFMQAIKEARITGPKYEALLRISKSHKNRKVKILFIRQLSLKNEILIYQVINKSGEVLVERVIDNESSIYKIYENFNKSKWNDNTLEIFNSDGSIQMRIDVSEHLE